MPALSKTQQRLMGIAYAVKNKDMKISDVDNAYRDKVKELVDGMTLKQLKDYASTKHKDLPEKIGEFLTLDNVIGMGDIKLPSETQPGSGDFPVTLNKKRKKLILNFTDFINEGKKPKGAPDWHDSDAPDAEGRFRDLNPKELAAWLIKTRNKDLKKISGSLTQQVVFNRNDDPAYAEKMEKTRKEVYKQLGREDLLKKD